MEGENKPAASPAAKPKQTAASSAGGAKKTTTAKKTAGTKGTAAPKSAAGSKPTDATKPTDAAKPANAEKPADAPKKPKKPQEEVEISDARVDGAGGAKKFVEKHFGDSEWAHKHSGVIYRILLALGVFLPLIPSIILLAFIHRTFGGNFPYYVDYDRSDTQVVVGIIVSTLSYFNVLTMSNMLSGIGIKLGKNIVFKWLLHNLSMDDKSDHGNGNGDGDGDGDGDEEKAKSKSKSKKKADDESYADGIKWFFGLFEKDRSWNEKLFGAPISWKDVWVGIFCAILLYVPHIIWTGALTPTTTSETLEISQDLANLVPAYTADTENNWANNQRISDDCGVGFPERSQIDGCPAKDLQQSIWNTISTASIPILAKKAQQKPGLNSTSENDYYYYYTPSYGVGSVASMFVEVPTDASRGIFEGAVYNEPGYSTNVVCARNSSSKFSLTSLNAPTKMSTLFQPAGHLPNSQQNVSSYVVVASSSGDAVAWEAASSPDEHVLSIATAGKSYDVLSNIQCTIKFQPQLYSVFLNDSGQYIKVSPVEDSQITFDTDGKLANTAVNQLGYLAQFQASPFNSELGDSLLLNMYYKAVSQNLTNADALSDSDKLAAVADSVQAALYDLLVYIGSSQLALKSPATQGAQYAPLVRRVQLGSPGYIIMAFAMTVLLFIFAGARALQKYLQLRKAKETAFPKEQGQAVLVGS